jgi:DNA-binding transcriptional regulator GbsR (MarR family)
MSLRALQDWGIIARVHKRGDRKEYFEAERDVWATFKTIARERKKRELDPVLASLYEVRDLTGIDPDAHKPAHPADPRLARHNERMDAMLEFMSAMEQLASLVLSPEGAGLRQALALFQK